MLSFCTTVCRPLTAQTDDHTPICISIFLIFHLPRDHNNNNNTNFRSMQTPWHSHCKSSRGLFDECITLGHEFIITWSYYVSLSPSTVAHVIYYCTYKQHARHHKLSWISRLHWQKRASRQAAFIIKDKMNKLFFTCTQCIHYYHKPCGPRAAHFRRRLAYAHFSRAVKPVSLRF